MIDFDVKLHPLDDGLTERLLVTAVADADPDEVMPPVDDSRPGWTPLRHNAFRTFHRDRFAGLTGPYRTVMYAVETGGELVGMIRLSLKDDTHGETGIWLGRSTRGRGIGGAALRALLHEAARAGLTAIVADTTPGNTAALALLRDAGATLTPDRDAGKVYARIPVPPAEASSPEHPGPS